MCRSESNKSEGGQKCEEAESKLRFFEKERARIYGTNVNITKRCRHKEKDVKF